MQHVLYISLYLSLSSFFYSLPLLPFLTPLLCSLLRAEAALASALDGFGHKWEINPGDGAFYGPKIDIKVHDALRRKHQVRTTQYRKTARGLIAPC